MSEEETQEEIKLKGRGDTETEIRFKPLQHALFSCPYLLIEDVWRSGPNSIVGNELSPLHCNNYFKGRWTGQDSQLYGPTPSKVR